MPTFVDSTGRVVAVFSDDGTPVMVQPPVSDWMVNGVPALRGVDEGEGIVEQWALTPPSDPLFGLDLLDYAERLGWTVVKSGSAAKERSTPNAGTLPFVFSAMAEAVALKADLYHAPAGSPKGGRFTTGPKQNTAVDFVSITPKEAGARLGLGKPLTAEMVKGAMGGLDGATFSVRGYGPNALWLDGKSPLVEDWSRKLIRGNDGKLYCHNVLFSLSPKGHAVPHLGTSIFARQVKGLAAMGANSIVADAKRGPDYNGYYTWPRLGYDGKPSKDVQVAAAKDGLPKYAHVSDFMKTQTGRGWWKAHGGTFEATFDLTPGSQSLRILDGYVHAKGISV